jgi:hypothetical protein
LYPSEQQRLQRVPRLSAVFRPDNGLFVGRQRLRVFRDVLGSMPSEAFVAYWDAGDVIFQGRLEPLWEIVQTNPGKVLAVREPASHPENPYVARWTQGIADPRARRHAQELLFNNPFLNAGFMAGTARSLLNYCRTVAGWYDGPTLAGSSDPGDQIALNLYCHSNPDNWLEVSESWNYTLALRERRVVYRDENGTFVDARGLPIHVVHGNGNTLQALPIRRARSRGVPA